MIFQLKRLSDVATVVHFLYNLQARRECGIKDCLPLLHGEDKLLYVLEISINGGVTLVFIGIAYNQLLRFFLYKLLHALAQLETFYFVVVDKEM